MVLYICNKCNKNFNKKQCYDVHINRKFPCKYIDITNDKINIDINNKILELEQKNKQLEEEIFTMKIQIKDNNDDIKIKLIQEYVYIIRESDFVQLNKDIYKIGRTAKTNPEDRFQTYRKGIEIVAFFKVNNSIECESKMIKCFSNHPNIIKKTEHGKEYFQGDRNELINEIVQIVKNYNN
jgi:hypothetical protein